MERIEEFNTDQLFEKLALPVVKIPIILFAIYTLKIWPLGMSKVFGVYYYPQIWIILCLLISLVSLITRERGYRNLSDYLGMSGGFAGICIIASTCQSHFASPDAPTLFLAIKAGGAYYQILIFSAILGLPLSFIAIFATFKISKTLLVCFFSVVGLFIGIFFLKTSITPLPSWAYKTYPYAITSLVSATFLFIASWSAGTKKQMAWMRYSATLFSLLGLTLLVYLFGHLIWMGMKLWWSILTPNFEITQATNSLVNYINRVLNYFHVHLLLAFGLSLAAWFIPMAYSRKHWLSDPWKIIINKSRHSKTGHWQGRFMENEKIDYLAKNKTGLPLGLDKKNRILRYLPNREKGWLKGHHTIIAATQGGKGVGAILPAILDHEHSVFVLDIKGELFMMTRKERQRKSKKVAVFNPYGMHGEGTACYNPFDFIRSDHVEEDIETIVDGIIMKDDAEDKSGLHFKELVFQYLKVAIEMLYNGNNPKTKNLIYIARQKSSEDFDEMLKCWAKNPAFCNGRAQAIAADILKMGEEERGSFASSLGRNINWVLSDKISHALQKSDFSFDELLTGQTDIFIAIPESVITTQPRLVRLMANIFISSMTRGKLPRDEVLGIFDEFCRLGKMNKVLDIATLLAGYNMTVLFVAQDKGQIVDVYNQNGAITILGNCATVRVWAIGKGDNITSKYIEECLPEQTIYSATERNMDGRDSASENRTKVLTATEFTELPFNEMLCLIRSNRPLMINTIFAPTHKNYKEKIGKSPLH